MSDIVRNAPVVHDRTMPVSTAEAPALTVLAFAVWFAGCICSVVAFLVFVWNPGTTSVLDFPWLASLLHVISTALAVFGTYISRGPNHPATRGWSTIVGFFAFFGGPLGYLAGVLCYLFGIGQPTELPLVDVVKAEMWIKQSDHVHTEIPSFQVQLQQELNTQPIVDLLPYADVPTSLAIINKLFETRSRDDIQLLHKMTQDRRLEVYQYALSKVDELEKDFGARIYQVKEQLRYRPNDPSLRVDLAKLYLDYTHSGLLDGLLEDFYWELTLGQIFEAVRGDEKARQELVPEIGRLFIEKNMHKEAAAMVEESIRRDPSQVNQQLLYLNSLYSQSQATGDMELLKQARYHALETGWAVKLPRRRDTGSYYDSVHFWFGKLRNMVQSKPTQAGESSTSSSGASGVNKRG